MVSHSIFATAVQVHLANGRINLVELPEQMSGTIADAPVRT